MQIAEQTILDDLEYLISHAITSPSQADYAVISGIQVSPPCWHKQFEEAFCRTLQQRSRIQPCLIAMVHNRPGLCAAKSPLLRCYLLSMRFHCALQIHSWGQSFDNQTPNLEFIAPSTVYTVVAGEKTYLNLSSIPQLTPRQIRVLSSSAASQETSKVDSNLDEVALLPSFKIVPNKHASFLARSA